jgi:hypothetical protein
LVPLWFAVPRKIWHPWFTRRKLNFFKVFFSILPIEKSAETASGGKKE